MVDLFFVLDIIKASCLHYRFGETSKNKNLKTKGGQGEHRGHREKS